MPKKNILISDEICENNRKEHRWLFVNIMSGSQDVCNEIL